MFDLLKLKFKVIGIPGSMTKEFSGSSDLKQKQSQWRLAWFFLNRFLYALMRFKFCLKQCPVTDLEKEEMQKVPYASAVGSLMYAQVCTRPDLAFIIEVLGRYLSNPGMQHWKAVKRVMRYLKRTRDFVLTYQKSDNLEIVGYSDSDFAGCPDSRRSTPGYIFLLAGGAV